MSLEKKFGMPVVDATTPISIVINRDDLDKGKVRDNQACAIARACQRQLHATHVSIGKDVAHVEMPDGNGGKHMVRFGIPSKSKKVIRANDLGTNGTSNEIVVTLVPKSPSQRLDNERRAMKKYKERAKDPNHKPQTRRKRGEGSYEQRLTRDLRGHFG